MKLLDRTLSSPEANLALDEALLEQCELEPHQEILRFWEASAPFVVLGIGCKVQANVHVSSCQKDGIPILRRPSGGGTVLQGPGCLNFALILNRKRSRDLDQIQSTHRFVLQPHAEIFAKLTGRDTQVKGFSDLTTGTLKFSGNAQRRKQNCVLFHGTFLLNLDLSKITRYLKLPHRQPGYRNQRPHAAFLTNINVSSASLKKALQRQWNAKKTPDKIPLTEVDHLIRTKYSRKDWNFRT